MSKEPQIGCIVHLNSGSPDLKVTSFCHECNLVGAEWKTTDGRLRYSYFPLESLTEPLAPANPKRDL